MIIMKGLTIKEDNSPGLLLQWPTIGLFFLATLIVHFITPYPSWMWRIIGSAIGVVGGSFLGWAIGAIGMARFPAPDHWTIPSNSCGEPGMFVIPKRFLYLFHPMLEDRLV
jgi:hypothetical protein